MNTAQLEDENTQLREDAARIIAQRDRLARFVKLLVTDCQWFHSAIEVDMGLDGVELLKEAETALAELGKEKQS